MQPQSCLKPILFKVTNGYTLWGLWSDPVIRRFFRKKRIQHYKQIIDEDPLNALIDVKIAKQLLNLWMNIKIGDISIIDEKQQGVIEIVTWCPHCYTLVNLMKEINQCIRLDNDNAVMALMSELDERHYLTLDMYLTNHHKEVIDVHQVLVRLKGLIEEHCYLLKDQERTYYQRLCVKLYHDIVTLSTALINEAYKQTHYKTR